MYALETIRALEREARETAALADAIRQDALALKRRIHAEFCRDPRCIDGWTTKLEEDGSLALIQCDGKADYTHVRNSEPCYCDAQPVRGFNETAKQYADRIARPPAA